MFIFLLEYKDLRSTCVHMYERFKRVSLGKAPGNELDQPEVWVDGTIFSAWCSVETAFPQALPLSSGCLGTNLAHAISLSLLKD